MRSQFVKPDWRQEAHPRLFAAVPEQAQLKRFTVALQIPVAAAQAVIAADKQRPQLGTPLVRANAAVDATSAIAASEVVRSQVPRRQEASLRSMPREGVQPQEQAAAGTESELLARSFLEETDKGEKRALPTSGPRPDFGVRLAV